MANRAIVQGKKKDNNDKTEGEEGVGDVRRRLTEWYPQQLTTIDTGESRGIEEKKIRSRWFWAKVELEESERSAPSAVAPEGG